MGYMRQELRRDAQLSIDITASMAKRLYDVKYRYVEFNISNKV